MPRTTTARLFYYEMLARDRAKPVAKSKKTPSGGWGRCMRLPTKDFQPIMKHLFPRTGQRTVHRADPEAEPDPTTGRRPRVQMHVPVQIGTLTWRAGGETRTVDVDYYPPNGARPSEGRLSKIHAVEPLRDGVPPAGEGRVFLTLVQDSRGVVTPAYVPEAYLRSAACDRAVSDPILACADDADDACQPGQRPRRVMWFVDYTDQTTRTYCHGR